MDENENDSFWNSVWWVFLTGSVAMAWAFGGNILGALLGSSFNSESEDSEEDF